MKVLYFAWVRTTLGAGQETVSPPPEVASVGALLDWLAARSAAHAEALAARDRIRVAVNQAFAGPADPVRADDEVAIFPPVTGG